MVLKRSLFDLIILLRGNVLGKQNEEGTSSRRSGKKRTRKLLDKQDRLLREQEKMRSENID